MADNKPQNLNQNKGNQQQSQQGGQNNELSAKLAELDKLIAETKELKAGLEAKAAAPSSSAELEEMRNLYAQMLRMSAQKEGVGAKKDAEYPLAADLPRFHDAIVVPLPAIFNGKPPVGAKQVCIGVQIPHGARRKVQLWMLPGMEAEITNMAVKAYFNEMGIWSCDHMPETWVEHEFKGSAPSVSGTVSTAEVSEATMSPEAAKAELAGMV